jgi:hypothetical protein
VGNPPKKLEALLATARRLFCERGIEGGALLKWRAKPIFLAQVSLSSFICRRS